MRVRLKYVNGFVVTVVETVKYDIIGSTLKLYEFGSVEPDYCISISSFDAERKIDLLFESGYVDLSCYVLTYCIFDEDSENEWF